MIVPYTALPAVVGGSPRPLLDVSIADMLDITFPCLVDSGAVNTLLPAWMGSAAGITLDGVPVTRLAVGGTETSAVFVSTLLHAGGHRWAAEVGFCHSWPYSWGLLGHTAFYRNFAVTFRAFDGEFEIQPAIG